MEFTNMKVLDKSFLTKLRSRHKDEIKYLRAGKVIIPKKFSAQMETLPISGGIDWTSFNKHTASFQWWINTLNFLSPTLYMNKENHDLPIFKAVAHSWFEQNPFQNPATARAWDGHAVAKRSEVFAAAWVCGVTDDWLHASLIEHAQFLAAPENHQGNWNHGLDQSLGLLALGVALDEKNWTTLAVDRIFAILAELVDAQGVAKEQSTAYQAYCYVRISVAIGRMEKIGISIPQDIYDRHGKMPYLIMHAVHPNGFLASLGDTMYKKLKVPECPPAEYALTQGRSGEIPAAPYAVFEAGYVFWRSGWGLQTSFTNEIHYSIRFGPGRIIHGHNDHTALTYYSRGQEILIDAGFDGYTPGSFRNYYRSPAAHNVAYCRSAKFQWDATTSMMRHEIFPSWQNYSLADEPHPKTRRKRHILFMQLPIEAICVIDLIKGESLKEYEQYWHLHASLRPKIVDSSILCEGNGFSVTVFQLWPHDDLRIAQGETAPILGWSAVGLGENIPSPTIVTRKTGVVTSFLTVIVLSKSDNQSEVMQRPLKDNAREIMISDGISKAYIKSAQESIILINPYSDPFPLC